jgi:anti-sigma-K factor RskA
MDTLTCDEVKALLPAHAIGALDADERAVVDAHVSSCADCTAALTEYNAVAFGLARAAPQHAPRSELRASVLTAAGRSQNKPAALDTTSWRERLQGWLRRPGFALVVALSLLAIVFTPLVLTQVPPSEAAQRAQIIANRTRAVAMRGTENAPEASATMSLGADDRSAVIDVVSLPPLADGKAYCAWLVYDGGKARDMGALFTIDEAGNAQVLINAPRSLATYGRFTVTIEDAGSKPEKPTGPRVLSS